MKVLYLIDSLEGYGAEKSIVQISLGLQEVIPVFIHLFPGDKLKSSLTEAGLKVYSLNIEYSWGYKEAIKLLTPIIKEERPDVIHSMLFRADMIARKLKVQFPEIVLVGSFVSNSYGKSRYSQMSILSKIKLFSTQLVDRSTADVVDFFVCNSKAIKKSNAKALGIPAHRIKVIYRGRTFEEFDSPHQVGRKLRGELGIEGKKVFLYVGRLIKSKGTIDLLKAFFQIKSKEPESVLLIAGEGPLKEEIVKRIKINSMEGDVRLLGYREDISGLLAASDYFVFPSYFEGLPGALIEAIIARKPSVVSDIPENKECFGEEGALFFPPGDVMALALKMEEALKIEDWNCRTQKSFTYAEANFRIENISRQYENFYKGLIPSN